MGLHDERDRFVAETLAYVQRLAADAPAEISTTPPAQIARERERDDGDLRTEMQARLQAFRSRQLFFEIEREAYYQQAMQRIRAVTEQWA